MNDSKLPTPPTLWLAGRFILAKTLGRIPGVAGRFGLAAVSTGENKVSRGVMSTILDALSSFACANAALLQFCLVSLSIAWAGALFPLNNYLLSPFIKLDDNVKLTRRPILVTEANTPAWNAYVDTNYEPDNRAGYRTEWIQSIEQGKSARAPKTFYASVESVAKMNSSGTTLLDPESALLANLNAGVSSSDALRQYYASVSASAAPQPGPDLSVLVQRFGPAQTCSGFDLSVAMMFVFPTAPGVCSSLKPAHKVGVYMVGIVGLIIDALFLFVLAMLGVFIEDIASKNGRKVAASFNGWKDAHAEVLFSQWESKQLRKSAGKPSSTAPASKRL